MWLMQPHTRKVYGLLYVNGSAWICRYLDRWGRTKAIDQAAIFATRAEAEIARNALLDQAAEECKAGPGGRRDFWFDVYGGLVTIEGIEIVTRHMHPEESTPE